MHNRLTEYLKHQGYMELSFSEMNEVIFEIPMPQEVKIFGEQLTVETALFRDVLTRKLNKISESCQ
jgi:hypothetical protein